MHMDHLPQLVSNYSDQPLLAIVVPHVDKMDISVEAVVPSHAYDLRIDIQSKYFCYNMPSYAILKRQVVEVNSRLDIRQDGLSQAVQTRLCPVIQPFVSCMLVYAAGDDHADIRRYNI